MTVLRQRMLDHMRIRNPAAETQTSYLRQVAKFARYHGQSPELLGPEDIRTYQLHLIDDRQLAPTSVAGTVAALRAHHTAARSSAAGTTARYLRLATTKVCSATSPLDLLPRPETASVPTH